MKIPKQVTILGKTFKVKQVSAQEIEKKYNGRAYGIMDFSSKLIYIDKSLNPEDMLSTYLHECCHVVTYIVGLNQVIPGDLMEILCESMANGIMDVLNTKASS